jgi:hypothetical protein
MVYDVNPVTNTINSTFFAQSNACGLLFDGGYMYVSNLGNYPLNPGSIVKVQLSDMSYTTFTSNLTQPFSIVIYSGYMYVSLVGGSGTFYVVQISMSSGNVTNATWASFSSPVCQLQVVGPNLFAACLDGVYVVPLPAGGPGTQIISFGTQSSAPVGMVLLGSYIYTTLNTGAPPSNSCVVNVYSGITPYTQVAGSWQTLTNSSNLFTDATYIYATDSVAGINHYTPYGGPVICFLEGSKILTDHGYRPIQELSRGSMIQTLKDGYVPIDIIRTSTIYNSGDVLRLKDRLYTLPKESYPALEEDLVLTGGHSILVDKLTELQESMTIEYLGEIYGTNGKNRLLTMLNEKAVPYPKCGTFTIYHICLEHFNPNCNYGIYANGLLVESCCKTHISI